MSSAGTTAIIHTVSAAATTALMPVSTIGASCAPLGCRAVGAAVADLAVRDVERDARRDAVVGRRQRVGQTGCLPADR